MSRVVPTALDLHRLPAELQAALTLAWPGCPEAQRRALLAPCRPGGRPLWPRQLWPWQPSARWWRPNAASESRAGALAFFVERVSLATGQCVGARLFDPAQPFFATPWTHAEQVLRSPVPDVFSDADFWAVAQCLCGGQLDGATHLVQGWAAGMRQDGAVQGARREVWMIDALSRLEASARGDFL